MALDIIDTFGIIEIMENYIERTRPPEHIRKELDINYCIEGQSVILNEIRPMFMDSTKLSELPYAKTTYIRKTNSWKVFWMRANQKWHSYGPCPEVKELKEFLQLVDEDENGCFKG